MLQEEIWMQAYKLADDIDTSIGNVLVNANVKSMGILLRVLLMSVQE